MVFNSIAALYDIHGNLPALEAVMAEVRRLEPDLILIGGDVIPGPMPAETLSFLFNLDLPVVFISGNGEREVLAIINGNEMGNIPENYRAAMNWTAQQISPEYQQLISQWPQTFRTEVKELGEVFFCHATPEMIPRSLLIQRRKITVAGLCKCCSTAGRLRPYPYAI
jgi:predicted MPP superfamily phosphohydrolase